MENRSTRRFNKRLRTVILATARRRLLHEQLERRDLLATWSYTLEWSYYDDMTGDGYTPDDPLTKDVVIELDPRYRFNNYGQVFPLPAVRQANPATFSMSGISSDDPLGFSEWVEFRVKVDSPDGYDLSAGFPTELRGFPEFFNNLDSNGLDYVLPAFTRPDGNGETQLVTNGMLIFAQPVFYSPRASGFLFEDLNMNQVREPFESRGLGGLGIYQDKNDNQRLDIGEQATEVDSDGYYSFIVDPDPDGTTLRIVNQDSVDFLSKFHVTTSPAGFVPRSRTDVIDQNFGIYRLSRVEGHLFDDLNGNGSQEDNETRRDNGLVFLDRDRDGLVNYDRCFDFLPVEPCGFVQPDGSYVIEQGRFGDVIKVRSPGIPPEVYSITQYFPWVVGESNQTLDYVDFGIFQNVQIGGQVYKDMNGDGVRDHHADTFIPGVDVLLDIGNNGTFEQVAKTDEQGAYVFYHVPPGIVWVLPSLKIPAEQTEPTTQIGFNFQVKQSAVSNYEVHFGVSTSGVFEPGKVDPPEPDPPPQDPYAREKSALLDRIQDRLDELLDLPLQKKLVDKVSGLLEKDKYGVPLASLDSLGKILSLLGNELIPIETDSSRFATIKHYFDDIYELTDKDLTRLEYVWNRGLDGIIQMLDQPQATWNAFKQGTFKLGARVDQAASSLLHELDRTAHDLRLFGLGRLLVDGAVSTVIDLFTPSTWEKLFVEMSGYDSFTKSMDPNLSADDRLLHYTLGVVTYFSSADLVSLGATAAKSRALALGDDIFREFSKSAQAEARDILAQSFSTRIAAKLDDVAAGGKGWLHALDEGVPIDLNFLPETGFSAEQVTGLIDSVEAISKKLNREVVAGFRSTNMRSMRHIRDGTALPKPLEIKAKTINEIDVKHLGFKADDIGLVGLKNPESIPHPVPSEFNTAAEYNAVVDRYTTRVAEFAEHEAKIKSGNFVHDDARGIVKDTTSGLPFAGDIDPVFFKDVNGVALVGQEYDDALKIFKASDALIQHGAETNIISDLMKKIEKEGIAKNSPAWLEALAKARGQQRALELAHTNGTEVILEVSSEYGLRKGPRLTSLLIVDDVAVASTAPKLNQEFERLLSNMGVSADEFARLTVAQRADLLRQRAASRVLLADDKLSRHVQTRGISSTQLQDLPANDVSKLLDAQHYGLKVQSDVISPTTRATIDATIINAGRNPGEFKVEGSETNGWVISRKNSPGPVFLDTGRDGIIAPLDALRVINELNLNGSHGLLPLGSIESYRIDVTGDDFVTPIDALVIINFLNSRPAEGGEGESTQLTVASPSSSTMSDAAVVSLQPQRTIVNLVPLPSIPRNVIPNSAPTPIRNVTPASVWITADVELELADHDQFFADLVSDLDTRSGLASL